MVAEIFQHLTAWYMDHINYGTIVLLMAIESSFIPLPSEIVIPPAAWKAAQGGLSLPLVVCCGALGSILGALFNYFMAIILGRKIIHSFARTRAAHFLLIKLESVERAEKYFRDYGNVSTFIGRLIPGVRQLISIPAGLAKMKLKSFVFFTFAGSTIWCIVLGALGYFLFSKKEVFEQYYKDLSYAGIVLLILFALYIIYSGLKNYKKKRKHSR